jgi:DNA modification methylase
MVTTTISAKLLNRQFIGYELEPEYFNIAQARIQAHTTTTTNKKYENNK